MPPPAATAAAAPLNVPTRCIFIRDNLEVLRGFNSESVDLIYLDPPFNSHRNYGRAGNAAASAAAFGDVWSAPAAQDEDDQRAQLRAAAPALFNLIDVMANHAAPGGKRYLFFMAIRLLEMRRVLRASGSLYLHVDPTMSHYLKCVMDAVFGQRNFLNEIIWGYKTGGVPAKKGAFARKHDVILFYAKNAGDNVFNPQLTRSYSRTLPAPHTKSGKKLGVLQDARTGAQYRMARMRDWWVEYGISADDDIAPLYRNNRERTGWPTQKPLSLLTRLICAASNKGGTVLDPFCGSAAACRAADALGRRWIGIDINRAAYEQMQPRDGAAQPARLRTDIPIRTDLPAAPAPLAARPEERRPSAARLPQKRAPSSVVPRHACA